MPNPFILFIILFVTLFSSVFIVNIIFPIKLHEIKYKSIDGLRGYLSFFVFLHHSYIYYFYLKTNIWEEPKSNLFNHFGQTSVLFFFMITSFLFTKKLIDTKNSSLNWKLFFVSRFFRIFPMYLFSIIIIIGIVVYKSHFYFYENLVTILIDIIKWITFTIAGNPDINTIKNTYIINAGVAWSLPYEWIFYFFLPILALFFKIRPSSKTLLISTSILIIIAIAFSPKLNLLLPFVSGIIAALIQKKIPYKTLFTSRSFSFLILFFLIISVTFFNKGRAIVPLIISTLIFILITIENSFFGILHWTISRKLGQITYSIYLVHGLILYIVFNFIIGIEKLSKYSSFDYFKVIAICIFPIILICQLSHLYIEIPFIKMTKKIVEK